jgi:hypothetical protein
MADGEVTTWSVYDDLPLAEVVELPEPVDEADRTAHLAIAWTDDPDPLPDADSRAFKLGVRHRETSAAPPSGERIDLGARVEVDGRWRWTEWTDDEDRTFSLSSVGLEQTTFDAIQASIRATGTGPLDVQVAAPEPFREVVRFAWDGGRSGPDESGSGRGPFLVDPVGGGYAALFSGPELGSGPHASLAVGRTTPAAAWLSIVTQSPTPPVVGEVRGHRSYEHRLMPESARSPEMEAAMEADPEAAASWQRLLETVILQWWEDDVAITIVASPASEARRMAESLRAVDESDWEAFASSATGVPDLERLGPSTTLR